MDLADYRTFVQERLIISTAETATETQIDAYVNAERDRLNARFRLLIAVDTLDFTADTETVTIPSDVVEILAIKRGEYLMQPLNPQTFAGYQAGLSLETSSPGGPVYYVREGTAATIRVLPTPTETETDAATIRYVQRPAILTADDDAPDELPREFHDLIAELVVYRMCLSEEDPEMASATWRVIYGHPGNPDDDGLMGRLQAYMNRTAGPIVNQIQLGGRRR